MSRSLFWMIYTPLAVVALVVGWTIGGPMIPRSAVGQTAATSAAQPATPAPTVAVASTDPASGARQALKDRLASSLDQVEASPCDMAARAQFLDAFADRSGAIADAAAETGDRPPEWNTDADQQSDQRIQNLVKAGYFTDDETGAAVLKKRMGASLFAQQVQASHSPGPRLSTKCPAAAATSP